MTTPISFLKSAPASAETSDLSIRALGPDETERGIAPVVAAFAADPIVKWFYPETQRYAQFGARLVKSFAGRAFGHRTAFSVEGYAATALWLPPGVPIDEEAMGALVEESLTTEEIEQKGPFLEQQLAAHPHDPHWYLPMIGVDPAHQGRGLGSALLEYSLEVVDRDRIFAYLEATSARSRALYERFGFEAISVIQAGDSPPMWPMVRQPR
jgi:ribosomal protein S18 acetylase RimI-like enzyme